MTTVATSQADICIVLNDVDPNHTLYRWNTSICSSQSNRVCRTTVGFSCKFCARESSYSHRHFYSFAFYSYICSLCPILCGPKLLILRRISWRMWVNPTPYQENISCLPNYFHYSIIVFVHFAAIDFFCFFSLPIRSRVALLTCKFGFTNYWLANIGSYARKINVCGFFLGGGWG